MTIKDLREINNLTQRDLAGMLGVTQTAVYKWELREVRFNRKIEELITSIFGYKKPNGRMTSNDIGTRAK